MRDLQYHNIFSGTCADGASSSVRVDKFVHKGLTIATTGVGTGEDATFKVVASDSEACPIFTNAASATNRWYYIETVNETTGAPVVGTDGVSISAADQCIKLNINSDTTKWVAVLISDTTGTFTVSIDVSLMTENKSF